VGVADDLLMLAGRLSRPMPRRGSLQQVFLRRSVSTAYYALFHLLIDQAVENWKGSQAVQLGLQRAFEHRNMRDISEQVWKGSWRGWSRPRPFLLPELRDVAKSFVELQEAQHQADYDNSKLWTLTEVGAKVAAARTAFQNWQQIRSHPAANEYLLALLVGKRRE
jgi:uncharacterized protein (UPF0332 family)